MDCTTCRRKHIQHVVCRMYVVRSCVTFSRLHVSFATTNDCSVATGDSPSQPDALVLHVIHLSLCSICTMSLCDASPHARTHAICVVLLHGHPQECSTSWTGCSLWTPTNRTPACMHLPCMPPCVCHRVVVAPCVYRSIMQFVDMCQAITCVPQEARPPRR